MYKRVWIELNKTECFATDAKADFYRKAEQKAPTGMLKTKWHQEWPFNAFRSYHKKRDLDIKNKRNAAGCAVVALAHLFYYYKDTPQVQKTLGSYLNKLQPEYIVTIKDGELSTKYEKGKSLDGVKDFAKYLHKNFLYGCITSSKGSSGIPREHETLFGKGKHLGLDSVLTRMKSSRKPKDFTKAAEYLYEAIVLNRVPVLIWLQQVKHNVGNVEVRYNGHFCIVDGCQVDIPLLLSTKSFEKACKFNFHLGNTYSWSNPDHSISYSENIETYTLAELEEKKKYDRIRKTFFYSSYYEFNPTTDESVKDNWHVKLEASRNLKHVYYKITNVGSKRITTRGSIVAKMKTQIVTTDGVVHKSEFYLDFDIDAGKCIVNNIGFSYAINQISSITVILIISDAFGNYIEIPYGVNLKPAKPSEIKSKFSEMIEKLA